MPHYSDQRVYRSVDPGLEEVLVEATRIACYAHVSFRYQNQVVYSLFMFSLLYVGMHHYSLVCIFSLLGLVSVIRLFSSIYLHRSDETASNRDTLRASGPLTRAELSLPFVGSGTDEHQ